MDGWRSMARPLPSLWVGMSWWSQVCNESLPRNHPQQSVLSKQLHSYTLAHHQFWRHILQAKVWPTAGPLEVSKKRTPCAARPVTLEQPMALQLGIFGSSVHAYHSPVTQLSWDNHMYINPFCRTQQNLIKAPAVRGDPSHTTMTWALSFGCQGQRQYFRGATNPSLTKSAQDCAPRGWAHCTSLHKPPLYDVTSRRGKPESGSEWPGRRENMALASGTV